MLKAVFFDWMNTLVHHETERHEIYRQTYRKFGIELTASDTIRGILRAEERVPHGTPVRWRETAPPDAYLLYQELVLKESGFTLPVESRLQVIRQLYRLSQETPFVLYDDVIPTFQSLKQQGMRLGLITNMPQSMVVVVGTLGLDAYLDAVITSGEIGVSKPDPAIFRAALERTRTSAQQAAYVGDQYGTDVVGARRVGITPVLIDRLELEVGPVDCCRITSLTELADCLGA